MNFTVTTFDNQLHREQTITLWTLVFGYKADHNIPGLVIDKKIQFGDGLFFVGLHNETVVGTVMAGYDGHRGWIYSIAVSPEFQNQGVGSTLLAFAEQRLSELGCMKINLQILESNKTVEDFYTANGYRTEKRISMGKQLTQNIFGSE